MQNKGLITVFAILFGLVSIYQLSYTFISSKVETDAQTYAEALRPATDPEGREELKTSYLDSVGDVPVMFGIDYDSAKEKELKRGLDLQFHAQQSLIQIATQRLTQLLIFGYLIARYSPS